MEGKEVCLPLDHTDVHADVAGFISAVGVTQRYQNPYSVKIEAVYVFPLPENAAVTDFVMTLGDRKIRGLVREREDAERIYEAAKNQGYRVAGSGMTTAMMVDRTLEGNALALMLQPLAEPELVEGQRGAGEETDWADH